MAILVWHVCYAFMVCVCVPFEWHAIVPECVAVIFAKHVGFIRR